MAPRADPRAALRQQGLAVLASLEQGPLAELTFGGRFKARGGDPQAELRAYYPSLEATKRLLAINPGLRGGVARALERYRFPESRRDALARSVALPEPAAPVPLGVTEAPGALGNLVITTKAAWKELVANARAGRVKDPLRAFAVDDETVTRIFQTWFGEGLPDLDTRQPGEVDLAMMRLYARGIELDVVAKDAEPPEFRSLSRLSITPERAAIARRALETEGRWVELNDLHMRGMFLCFSRSIYEFDHQSKRPGAVPIAAAEWPTFLARISRGDPEAFALPPTQALGRAAKTPAQMLAGFRARDPLALNVDDPSLEKALKAHTSGEDWTKGLADLSKEEALRLLRLYERGAERGVVHADALRTAFRHTPALRADPDILRALARVICKTELRERAEKERGGDHPTSARGTSWNFGIDERRDGHWLHRIDAFASGHQTWVPGRRPAPEQDVAGVVKAPEPPELVAAREEALRFGVAQVAARPAPKVWAETLLRLLDGPMPNRHEFGELLEALRPLALEGRLPRLALDQLPAALGDRLMAAIADYAHPGAVVLLGGLLLDFPAPRLERALLDAGAGPGFAKKFAQSAVNLSQLTPEDLLEVLTLPNGEHERVPTREIVARSDLMAGHADPARFEQVWVDLTNVPQGEVVRIYSDVAMAHRDPAVAPAIRRFLNQKVERGELPGSVLTLMISIEAAQRMEPALAAALEDLLRKPMSPEAQAKALGDLVQVHGAWVSPDRLVEYTLDALHQRELVERPPLDELAAKAKGANKAQAVKIGTTELPVDQRPDRDLEAIPSATSTALVMCPATKDVVERAATLWFAGIPFILEGSPGTAKSTVPAYLARLTQTPFRSFPCTPESTAEELIGRYVGGLPAEERTPVEVLEKESTQKLVMRLNGFNVELDPAWERSRMIQEIQEIEAKPRWVNGPLLRAMRDGEALLLDEYDLLPNGLKVRLNAIRDEKGSFTVQEHNGRRIQVDPHFRLICAQNGATADRAQVEASNLSRFQVVHTRDYQVEDFLKILEAKFGPALGPELRVPLARGHAAIAQLASRGQLERTGGGITFGPRDLLKTAKRVSELKGGALPAKDLLRREMQEIYRDVLRDPRDQQVVNDLLDLHVPSQVKDFYPNLRFEEDEHTWRIGDVEGTKREGDPPFVPVLSRSRVESKRLLEMEYRYRKALVMGENVLLVGGPASGKTHLVVQGAKDDKQPYFSMTGGPEVEASLFVGSYQERGWQPGVVESCAKERGILALHEVNACDPRMLEVMNSALDDRRSIFVPKGRGYSLSLPVGTRIVATMNDVGQGFGGRGLLSRPFRNRFTMLRVPDLKDPAEYLSLTRAAGEDFGVDPRLTQTVVDLHLAVLGHFGERRDRPALTFRTIENCLEMIGALCRGGKSEAEAYVTAGRTVYTDVKSPQDRARIEALVFEVAK